MKRMLTVYQLLISLCLIFIWTSLILEGGVINKWDAPQWMMMSIVTITAIVAVTAVEMTKRDS